MEPKTVSFVVKITSNDYASELNQIGWHGLVTHVPSGEKCYFKNLGELEVYIAAHLEQLGMSIEPALRSRHRAIAPENAEDKDVEG